MEEKKKKKQKQTLVDLLPYRKVHVINVSEQDLL
jgi:hypothetical protein